MSGRRQDGHDAQLSELRLVAVALPAVFIISLQVLRPLVIDALWPGLGDTIVSALTAIASIVFGLMMFRLIGQMVEDDRYRSTVAERDRIARELHDSLAQVLGATNLRLQATLYHPVVASTPEVRDELSDVASMCQEAYKDVREAILGLKEGPSVEHALVEGLQVYAEKFSRRAGIETSVVDHLDGEPGLAPLAEIQVIRVLQEALTNARKHSGARHARITLTEAGDQVAFVVEDDGQGFVVDAAGGREGFGLHSMRERTAQIGGTLLVESGPGLGTKVTLTVPREQRAARPPRPRPQSSRTAV